MRPLIEWMEQETARPQWEVSNLSRTMKLYWNQWDSLQVRNGLLGRRWDTPDGKSLSWLLVVPKSMRSELLKVSHDTTSGHLGVKKTLTRVHQRFYWVGVRQDVTEWVKICDICCAKKGPKIHGSAPLQLYQVGAPMERVAVDIAGPLPQDGGQQQVHTSVLLWIILQSGQQVMQFQIRKLSWLPGY